MSEQMTEPVKVEMTDPVFVLRGGAYLLDEHAGVLIDSAGNYSAKTRGNPRSLSLLLRAIADDIDDAADSSVGSTPCRIGPEFMCDVHPDGCPPITDYEGTDRTIGGSDD